MDDNLDTLFSHISAWCTDLDGYSTFPVFDIKRLQSLSRIWLKERDTIRRILAALPPLGEPDSYPPSLETRP